MTSQTEESPTDLIPVKDIEVLNFGSKLPSEKTLRQQKNSFVTLPFSVIAFFFEGLASSWKQIYF